LRLSRCVMGPWTSSIALSLRHPPPTTLSRREAPSTRVKRRQKRMADRPTREPGRDAARRSCRPTAHHKARRIPSPPQPRLIPQATPASKRPAPRAEDSSTPSSPPCPAIHDEHRWIAACTWPGSSRPKTDRILSDAEGPSRRPPARRERPGGRFVAQRIAASGRTGFPAAAQLGGRPRQPVRESGSRRPNVEAVVLDSSSAAAIQPVVPVPPPKSCSATAMTSTGAGLALGKCFRIELALAEKPRFDRLSRAPALAYPQRQRDRISPGTLHIGAEVARKSSPYSSRDR